MRKFGPGVIRKDQAIADRKKRRTSPRHARFIDGEQPGADQHIAFGSRQQTVEFVRRQSPLQEKQVDGQSEPIAGGQMLRAIYRQMTPLQVGKILQTETLGYETLGVSGANGLRNGVAKTGYIGMIDDEGSRFRHRLKHTSIETANEPRWVIVLTRRSVLFAP
jgi:hypothetical protein